MKERNSILWQCSAFVSVTDQRVILDNSYCQSSIVSSSTESSTDHDHILLSQGGRQLRRLSDSQILRIGVLATVTHRPSTQRHPETGPPNLNGTVFLRPQGGSEPLEIVAFIHFPVFAFNSSFVPSTFFVTTPFHLEAAFVIFAWIILLWRFAHNSRHSTISVVRFFSTKNLWIAHSRTMSLGLL